MGVATNASPADSVLHPRNSIGPSDATATQLRSSLSSKQPLKLDEATGKKRVRKVNVTTEHDLLETSARSDSITGTVHKPPGRRRADSHKGKHKGHHKKGGGSPGVAPPPKGFQEIESARDAADVQAGGSGARDGDGDGDNDSAVNPRPRRRCSTVEVFGGYMSASNAASNRRPSVLCRRNSLAAAEFLGENPRKQVVVPTSGLSASAPKVSYNPHDPIKGWVRIRSHPPPQEVGPDDEWPPASCVTESPDSPRTSETRQARIINVACKGEVLEVDGIIDDSEVYGEGGRETEICQKRVYHALGKKLIDNAFAGLNSCLIAYGETGSGKTHSLTGPISLLAESEDGGGSAAFGGGGGGTSAMDHPERGLLPRVLEGIFQRIEKERLILDKDSSRHKSFRVSIKQVEIYREHVRDLSADNTSVSLHTILSDEPAKKLRVRNHPITGPFVEGLIERETKTVDQAKAVILHGLRERTTAASGEGAQPERVHAMQCGTEQETSTRSHVLFTITLTQIITENATSSVSTRVANLTLVDLAGAEALYDPERDAPADSISTPPNTHLCASMQDKAGAARGADETRVLETRNINRSLTTLRRVIDAVGMKKKSVPYRESVLTWILSDAIGGNSRTYFLGTVHPGMEHENHTHRTLEYAVKVRGLSNTIAVNEDDAQQVIADLRESLLEMKLERNQAETQADGVSAARVRQLEDEMELAENAVSMLDGYAREFEAHMQDENARLLALVAQREEQNAALQNQLAQAKGGQQGQAQASEELVKVQEEFAQATDRFTEQQEENITLKHKNRQLASQLETTRANMKKLKDHLNGGSVEYDPDVLSEAADTDSVPLTVALQHQLTELRKAYHEMSHKYQGMKELRLVVAYENRINVESWCRRADMSERDANRFNSENHLLAKRITELEEELGTTKEKLHTVVSEQVSTHQFNKELLDAEFEAHQVRKELRDAEVVWKREEARYKQKLFVSNMKRGVLQKANAVHQKESDGRTRALHTKLCEAAEEIPSLYRHFLDDLIDETYVPEEPSDNELPADEEATATGEQAEGGEIPVVAVQPPTASERLAEFLSEEAP